MFLIFDLSIPSFYPAEKLFAQIAAPVRKPIAPALRAVAKNSSRRFQRGSVRVESRKNGPTWVLRYFVTRPSDSRRVEHKIAVGLVYDFPSESAAWAEVEKQHLQTQINRSDFRGHVTFADLAQHYMQHELDEQIEAVAPKSHTTIAGYKRILKNRCLDRWGKRTALGMEPLEIEQWLKAIKREEQLENPTLDKTRRVMSLVFKHGQR